MGVRTCESRCLFSGSKGEVCCIEPLHAKVDLRDHPITQYSLLAMASLTKVTLLAEGFVWEITKESFSGVYWNILIFLFFLKILVIGLKPSLKVWMTFPYGRVSKEAKQLLFGLWLQTGPRVKGMRKLGIATLSARSKLCCGIAVVICWSGVGREQVKRLLSPVPMWRCWIFPVSRKGGTQESLSCLSSLLQPGCSHRWDVDLSMTAVTLD